MASRRRTLLLALLIGVALGAALQLDLLRPAERIAYDQQLRLRLPSSPHPDIAIVAIDDQSLDALGPWPWPRSLHARLVDVLRGSARAVAFDIFFLEPDPWRQGDAEFAAAARRAGNVFVASFLTPYKRSTIGPYGVRMQSPRLPYRELYQAAAGVGVVNVLPDPDGIVRSVPVSLECKGEAWPSMAAQIANLLFNRARPQAHIALGRRLALGPYEIPVDAAGEMLVNYPGGYGVFRTVSFADVLSGRVPPAAFRGKVVLVGFTATGLSDLRSTPLSPAVPGVEVNAAVLDTMLKRSFLRRAPTVIEWLLILLAAVLPAWWVPAVSRFRGMLFSTALAVGLFALAFTAFQSWGYWLPVATPLLAVGITTGGLVLADMRRRERDAIHVSSSVGALALATRMIAASTSTQSLLPAIREEMQAVMQAGRTFLFVADPDRPLLQRTSGREQATVTLGEGSVGKAAAERRSLLILPDDPTRAELAPLADGPVSSAMVVPLVQGERLLGVALVADRVGGAPYGPDDLELLHALAYEAGVALENAELYGKLEGKIDLANQELRRAYAQLATESERLERLLENMADAVIMTDTEGRILFLNPAARTLFRLKDEDAVGAPLAQAVGIEALPNLARAVLAGDQVLATAEVALTDPERKVLNATAARITDDEGRPVGIVTVLSDVTLLKELSDMKTEFVSLVTHELRTPLTSIQGFSQTLRDDTEGQFDLDSRQEFLGIICDECQRLLTMINEMLDASRLEAGRPLPMNWGQVDLPALANRVVRLQGTVTQIHTFRVDFPEGFPQVAADEDRLTQVLTNVLSNAVKYSPSGGEIAITGLVGPGDEVGEGEVKITIADQGLGMTPEQIGQLFQRYQRLDQDATKRIRGTGLGLYLTKGLVEAHHGRIWADSPGPEKGSRFHLVLPIEQPE